jgi:hypothetical protein
MPSRRFTPCALVSPIFACKLCSPVCVGIVGGTFSLSGENPVSAGDCEVSDNLVADSILEHGEATLDESLAKCELLKDTT